MNIKFKVKNAIYTILQPYRKLRNRILSKRYPWLIPYDGWAEDSHKKYNYSYLMWEPDEGGWSKSFFYMMMEDIRRVAKRNGIIKNLHVAEQKEKWGQLVFDLYGYDDDISQIVNAYTTASGNICASCGEPDVGYYKKGWILPVCKKCYNYHSNALPYDETISNDRRMSNWYEYSQWDDKKEQWIHYKIDITNTTNKIRRKWNHKHPFRRKEYA